MQRTTTQRQLTILRPSYLLETRLRYCTIPKAVQYEKDGSNVSYSCVAYSYLNAISFNTSKPLSSNYYYSFHLILQPAHNFTRCTNIIRLRPSSQQLLELHPINRAVTVQIYSRQFLHSINPIYLNLILVS